MPHTTKRVKRFFQENYFQGNQGDRKGAPLQYTCFASQFVVL